MAQLDSASDSDSEGRRFESFRVGQKQKSTLAVLFVFAYHKVRPFAVYKIKRFSQVQNQTYLKYAAFFKRYIRQSKTSYSPYFIFNLFFLASFSFKVKINASMTGYAFVPPAESLKADKTSQPFSLLYK